MIKNNLKGIPQLNKSQDINARQFHERPSTQVLVVFGFTWGFSLVYVMYQIKVSMYLKM